MSSPWENIMLLCVWMILTPFLFTLQFRGIGFLFSVCTALLPLWQVTMLSLSSAATTQQSWSCGLWSTLNSWHVNSWWPPQAASAYLNSLYSGQLTIVTGCRPFLVQICNLLLLGLRSSVLLDTRWVSFFDTSHLYSCGSTLVLHGNYLLGYGRNPLYIHWYDALIKQEQCIFGSPDVLPRDIFNSIFADGQPTYVFWYLCLKQFVTSSIE